MVKSIACRVACLLAIVLAGCTSLTPRSPLASPAALTQRVVSATPSLAATPVLDRPAPTDTPQPAAASATHTAALPTLSDSEIAQTRTALAPLYVAQTQYALLSQPSLTPTPCPSPPCLSPTPTWSWPKTKTPTLTPTATTQVSDLTILTPGPLSKVVSPIHLEAAGLTGAGGMIRIELFNETGQLIMRQVLRYGPKTGAPFFLALDIPFEIPVVSEAARLVVSTDDDRNRLQALTSSDLILLSMGDAAINPNRDNKAPIILKQPAENATVASGFMEVTGLVRAMSTQPLMLELYADNGALVGSRQASVVTPLDGAYHPFEAIVPYTVSQSRAVRLIVRQEGDHIPGNVALSSILLTVQP